MDSANQEDRSSTPAIGFMVLVGMVVSGMIESTAFPKPMISTTGSIVVDVGKTNASQFSRRYCDPPNITIFKIYEMDYESEEGIEADDYDFSQLEEMDFQMTLGEKDAEDQWRWELKLWGCIVGPIPACWLASKFGPGKVFGFCLLAAGMITMFVPTADKIAQMALLPMQGLIHSAILPCAILLGHACVTADTRAMYLVILAGARAGTGIGELIPSNFLPFASCVSAITWISSWVLMLKSPNLPKQKHAVPWKKIFGSRVVWMSAAAVFGTELAQAAAGYSLRQYMYLVYNYAKRCHFAIPWAGHFTFAIICGKIAHIIERTKFVSRTTSRRIFVYISHFIPAGTLFISCFVGCDEIAPLLLYSIGIIFSGAAYCGAYVSALDVAPNFAAVVVALVCTCGAIARLLPVILTVLVLDGLIPGSWRMILSISGLITLVTAMLFMLRGSSRPQVWDNPDLQRLMPRRLPTRLNVEDRILKVLMVQERDITRARACSTSLAHTTRIVLPKRASIS